LFYPLDYIQTRLISNVILPNSVWYEKREFTGIKDVIRQTRGLEGPVGFYRGIVPFSIYSFIFSTSTLSGIYLPRYFQTNQISQPLNYAMYFLVGALSMNVLAYPFEVISRRMMLTSGEPVKYKSFIDALIKIQRQEGIKSLYRGYSIHFCTMFGTALIGAFAFLSPNENKLD